MPRPDPRVDCFNRPTCRRRPRKASLPLTTRPDLFACSSLVRIPLSFIRLGRQRLARCTFSHHSRALRRVSVADVSGRLGHSHLEFPPISSLERGRVPLFIYRYRAATPKILRAGVTLYLPGGENLSPLSVAHHGRVPSTRRLLRTPRQRSERRPKPKH